MRDPVCGAEVDPLRARSVGIFGGRTYYFCSPEHRADFARDPQAYGAAVGSAVPRTPVSGASGALSIPITVEAPRERTRKFAGGGPQEPPTMPGAVPVSLAGAAPIHDGEAGHEAESPSLRLPRNRSRLMVVLGALLGAGLAALYWKLR